MKAKQLFLTVVLVFAFGWQARALEIVPMIIDKILSKPHAGHEQGWLEFSNEDRVDYYVDVRDREQRIVLSRGGRHGGVRIPSGNTVYVVVPARRTWTMVGDSRESVVVAAFAQRSTPVRITPLGRGKDVGIRVTVHDGRKNVSAMLFGYSSRPEWNAPAPRRHAPTPAPAPKHVPNPAPKPSIGGPSAPQPGRPGSNIPPPKSPAPSNPNSKNAGPNNQGSKSHENTLPGYHPPRR